MSQPTYAYNPIAWSSVDESMSAANARIRANLDRLESDINAHIAAWTDEARRVYDEHRAKWNAAAGLLPGKLAAVVAASTNIRGILDRTTQQATYTMGG